MKLIASFLVCSALLFHPAFAADRGVVADLTAYKVVTRADGKERLESGERAKPGDVIEYRVVYRNTGNVPAKNVAATLPVPSNGLHYLANSSAPQAVLASIDGKTFAPAPLVRSITLPNGRQETRVIPVSEYRFLRWQLGDLPAGASITVSARMQLDDQSTAQLATH